MKTYNITGSQHGILATAGCVKSAKRTFRKSYPHEKIFYAKEAGKISPRHIY